MISSGYFEKRKQWTRPQAVILSNNSSGILNGVPQISGVEKNDFIILSDHNRSDILITPNRIENRKRMINAHMRSYYLADKVSISMSWEMLPSRAYSEDASFSQNGLPGVPDIVKYTVDGGAGGEDLLTWYENNTGSFYVFLSYDKPSSFTSNKYSVEKFKGYSDVLEVFCTSFEYAVVKRGRETHDFWNISLQLEEV